MQQGGDHDHADDQYRESEAMDTPSMRAGESCELVEIADQGTGQDDTDNTDLQIFEDDSVQGFFRHSEPVYSIACSPSDPNIVLTGGGDNLAFQWSITTGEPYGKPLLAHSDSVIAVGYSHDGSMLATGSMDGTCHVYSGDGGLLHSLDGPSSEVEWLTWHPIGNVMAFGSGDGTCWVWHLTPTSKALIQVLSQDGQQNCATFTGNGGKTLCTGSVDGTFRVWSCKTGQTMVVVKPGHLYHTDAICSMHAHPNKPIVLTGSQDQTAKWVHTEHGKVLGSISDNHSAVEAVAFAKGELGQDWAATGGMDGSICIIDISRGSVRAKFNHDDGVVKLVWLRIRPYLLCSCSLDGTVRLWDTRSCSLVQTFRGHTGPVYDIAISSDERFVISCADDHVALVFEISQS